MALRGSKREAKALPSLAETRFTKGCPVWWRLLKINHISKMLWEEEGDSAGLVSHAWYGLVLNFETGCCSWGPPPRIQTHCAGVCSQEWTSPAHMLADETVAQQVTKLPVGSGRLKPKPEGAPRAPDSAQGLIVTGQWAPTCQRVWFLHFWKVTENLRQKPYVARRATTLNVLL